MPFIPIFQMYHRQIFKLLLSNKVLDQPHQRRLFKTSDLVELFNFNEPIDGESSESDRLFKESKLIPVSSNFSVSKIEKMRRLASALSKKISATIKSASTESENLNNNSYGNKHDKQNSNSKDIEIFITKNDVSEDRVSSFEQINKTQKSLHIYNDDLNANSDESIKQNNVKSSTSKTDKCEQDVASTKYKDSILLGKKSKSILNDDKIIPSSSHKRKRYKKDSSKKNVSAIFEGERISCLIGRRLGRPDEKKKLISTRDDDYVLKKLFAKSSKSIIYLYRL